MKVKYIKSIEDSWLTTGQEYIVYAVSAYDDCVNYCLCIDGNIGWCPFYDFEITDPRPSRFWILNVTWKVHTRVLTNIHVSYVKDLIDCVKSFFGKKTCPSTETRLVADSCLSFKEFANEDFYERFIDGGEEEEEIFYRYQQAMELEFPNPSVLEKADVGDRDWLICPFCIDAWEHSDTTFAMVVCPKCEKVMHNPRYDDGFYQLPIRWNP